MLGAALPQSSRAYSSHKYAWCSIAIRGRCRPPTRLASSPSSKAITGCYYELLGVESDASANEIKSAWRRLCHELHPDKGGCAGAFMKAREAYLTLSVPQRRAAYDRKQSQAAAMAAAAAAAASAAAAGQEPDWIEIVDRGRIIRVPRYTEPWSPSVSDGALFVGGMYVGHL